MNKQRSRQYAIAFRGLFVFAVSVGTLFSTGCNGQFGQQLQQGVNGLGGGFGGGNNFNSGGGYSPLGGGGGGGYGGLNSPGVAGAGPVGSLPPPAAASGQAAQIFQKYAIRINGANATPQILDTVAKGLEHYAVENTRGIQQINVLSSRGSITGMWRSSGNSAQIDLYARTNGSQEPVKLRTVTHEIGHHWTLLSDRQAGDAFDQALGETAAGYVSPYARTGRSDKLAEAVAFLLVGGQEFSKEMSILPGWRPSPQAVQIVKSRIVDRR